MRALASLGVILAALALPWPGRAEQPPASADDLLLAIQSKLQSLADSAGPSVACVAVSRSDQYPKPQGQEHPGQLGGFDPIAFTQLDPTPSRLALAKRLDLSDPQNIPDTGWCGGVVIDSDGLVLTTYHAVERATKIYVHLPGGRGSYADIHAADARSDFAVLKLLKPIVGLRAVPLGEVRASEPPRNTDTLKAGTLLALMAYPYSSSFVMERATPWLGSVGTVLRPKFQSPNGPVRSLSWYSYGMILEFNTIFQATGKNGIAPNLVCNGAPVFGLNGELIGLTTTMAAVIGNFDGPVHILPFEPNIRKIIEVLRRGEEVEYGFLGVVVQDAGGFRDALVLAGVTPRGPAALAGLTVNDLIVSIDGKPVRRYEDLLLHGGTVLAGSSIKLRARDGRGERELNIVLAKFKNDAPFIASRRPEPVFGLRVDYSSVIAQTSGSGVPRGVVVREILPESPAAARFKTLGENPTRWLITRVNGKDVTVPKEFYAAAREQPAITLKIVDLTAMMPVEQEVTLP